MSITPTDVAKVAELVRLRFGADELPAFTGHLNQILLYIDKLNELDTDEVPATSHVLDLCTPLRPDEPALSLSREEALANAPSARDGRVSVPKFVDAE